MLILGIRWIPEVDQRLQIMDKDKIFILDDPMAVTHPSQSGASACKRVSLLLGGGDAPVNADLPHHSPSVQDQGSPSSPPVSKEYLVELHRQLDGQCFYRIPRFSNYGILPYTLIL